MRMYEWDAAGREPLFGHQADWLGDLLDAADATDVAVFAVAVSNDDPKPVAADKGVAARYYVACQLGLLVASVRPDRQGRPVLTSTVTPWKRVEGLELRSTTELDDALRRQTTWQMIATAPELDLSDEGQDAPLVQLWRECAIRVGHPPTMAPKDPD